MSGPGAVRELDGELAALLRAGTPFIDVRAPAEFADGTVPGAVNLPLLSNDERHQVGLCYRSSGQQAAIELGERLVSGTVREARLNAWLEFSHAHPDVWLYCWRGGLRSETVQSWLADAGARLPRVAGGFKALRRTCLNVLAAAPGRKRWLVVGGRTGSGKTQLLQRTEVAIDLEGRANHRGSAFGARNGAQPQPIDFENQLAVDYLKHSSQVLLLEDESRTIGRLAIPAAWHAAMGRAELLILEADLSERLASIEAEYVQQPLRGGVCEAELLARFQGSLDRIRKRLGSARHRAVSDALERAFAGGDHRQWIELLLNWYYDPMYDYQLARKQQPVLARGRADDLLRVIEELASQR